MLGARLTLTQKPRGGRPSISDRPIARAKLARESLPYATSISDVEWAVLALLLPAPSSTGHPRRRPLREVFDGILYVLRTGCARGHLPLDFPPWSTVHRWFLRLSQTGVFERLAHALTPADRERVGCETCPTGCVVDAQAARSDGVGVAGKRGYDPARRVVGRPFDKLRMRTPRADGSGRPPARGCGLTR